MATVPIGRDPQLDAVRRLADDIQAGGDSLLVRGAAGVGKSTLLTAIPDQLSPRRKPGCYWTIFSFLIRIRVDMPPLTDSWTRTVFAVASLAAKARLGWSEITVE